MRGVYERGGKMSSPRLLLTKRATPVIGCPHEGQPSMRVLDAPGRRDKLRRCREGTTGGGGGGGVRFAKARFIS